MDKNTILFHNLYIQTEYNFLSSTVSLKRLDEELYRFSHTSIAICDNEMRGAYKFYKLVKKHEEDDVKAIIGLKCKFSNNNVEDSVLLYACNNKGYQNLMRISSFIETNPTVVIEDIKDWCNDIICVVPFYESIIRYYYDNNYFDKIDEVIKKYKYIFDKTYLGLSLQIERYNIDDLKQIGINNNIKCVAIHKVNMMRKDHIDALRIVCSIGKGVNNYNLNELDKKSYFLSNDELLDLYKDHLDLVLNQEEIVNNCNVTIEFNGYLFPKVEVPNGDSKEYLALLCKKGLNRRLEQNRKIYNKNYSGKIEIYRNRLLHELDVIDKMGFNDYFLVVYDYVKYAKTHDILVGPGRGSAGGSLVSYSLGITDIDPIEYGLLFERFLNIERITMPDIDVDFEDVLRTKVMQYLGTKYGKTRVAHIATCGTLGPRLVLKDIARVIELDNNKLSEVLKYIPDRFSDLSLSKIVNNSPILQKMIEHDDTLKYLFDNALILEGLPRNVSTHAAGLIMAPDDLYNYTPLSSGLDGLMQTQYEASDLEDIGLVKMDILGLSTLSTIKNITTLIRREHPDFDYNKINFYDKDVYDMLRRGETTGIFQLEKEGVRKVLGRIQTSGFEDIVSATSLYRPGPMDNIPSFASRKLGKEKIEYLDPSIEEVLRPTYGVIVYQEQIMLIANIFAGYSLGEADVLRRAISKKKASVMEQEKEKFINKALELGRNKNVSKKVFDYIEKFASYGFNRSHAVAYSVIAYKMAYMKYHYNVAYMCSILNNVIGDSVKTLDYISECKKNGIKVYHPSINKSEAYYIYKDKAILYPLLGIKGIGEVLVNRIIDERSDGPFKDFDDFIKRMKKSIDKKTVCSLIYAGCFDEFKETRRSLVENFDLVYNRASYDESNSLFNMKLNIRERKKINDEFSFEEISLLEKEALGFNLKYDLFIKYLPLKQKYRTVNLIDLKEGVQTPVLFLATNIRTIVAKNGKEMAFAKASDNDCDYDAVFFNNVYEPVKNKLINGCCVVGLFRLETKVVDGINKQSLIGERIIYIS